MIALRPCAAVSLNQNFDIGRAVDLHEQRRNACDDALQRFEVRDAVSILASHAALDITFVVSVVRCFFEGIAQHQPGTATRATRECAAALTQRYDHCRAAAVQHVVIPEVNDRG